MKTGAVWEKQDVWSLDLYTVSVPFLPTPGRMSWRVRVPPTDHRLGHLGGLLRSQNRLEWGEVYRERHIWGQHCDILETRCGEWLNSGEEI